MNSLVTLAVVAGVAVVGYKMLASPSTEPRRAEEPGQITTGAERQNPWLVGAAALFGSLASASGRRE